MITLDSRADEVTRLLEWVEPLLDASELDQTSSFHFRCALVEVVNNSIQHAYGFESGQPVEIQMTLEQRGVSATVRDRGPAFDAPAPKADNDSLAESGRGYEIIRAWVDQIEFERVDGWNIYRLFRLKSPG